MSIRSWLTRLLSEGESVEPAPDSVVELDSVWLLDGPILLQALDTAGVKANGVESTTLYSTGTGPAARMRIFVLYEDLERAQAVLEQHRPNLHHP